MRAIVGMTVLYYQNGLRNQPPRPAMVMQAGPNNSVLALNVFPEQGGSLAFKRCVYHIDDPHLQKNPNVGMSYGAWEHVNELQSVTVDTSDLKPAPRAEAAPAPSPVVRGAPESPFRGSAAPSTGDPQADLMNKLLQTAGSRE